ncbi:hypothetical protein ACFL59_13630, partial [Planctomycetota bacterium]
MYQRVQRASYAGARPTSASFNSWLRWMEILGYLKQVGFRHTFTEAGIEGYDYLKGLDDGDLLGGRGALSLLAGLGEDEEGESEAPPAKPYLTAEELGAGPDTATGEALPKAEPPGGIPQSAAAAPDSDLDDELDGSDFGPQHEVPEVPPELAEEFGTVDGASPAESSHPASPTVEQAEADLSEDEEDAIRDLFGDEALEEIRPKKPDEPKVAEAGIGDEELYATLDALQLPAAVGEVTHLEDATVATPDTAAAGQLAETEETPACASHVEPGPSEQPSEASSPGEEAAEEPQEEQQGVEEQQPVSDPSAVPVTARAEPKPGSGPRAATERRKTATATEPTGPPRPAPSPERKRHRPLAVALEPSSEAISSSRNNDLLAAMWETGEGRHPLTASTLGLDADDVTEGTRSFCLFRLALAGVLLEGPGSAATKLGLYRRLQAVQALENSFFLDWTVDRTLEALGLIEPSAEVAPCVERLIHLPRLKRAFNDTEALAQLDTMGEEARPVFLSELSGYSLLGGAYWVDREMRRLGLWQGSSDL